MKLPIWPKDERGIIDGDGKFVCLANTTEARDYIVQAINSHEKLVKIIDEIEAVSCGEDQVGSDGVYDDSDGLLWIYKRIQALSI